MTYIPTSNAPFCSDKRQDSEERSPGALRGGAALQGLKAAAERGAGGPPGQESDRTYFCVCLSPVATGAGGSTVGKDIKFPPEVSLLKQKIERSFV